MDERRPVPRPNGLLARDGGGPVVAPSTGSGAKYATTTS
jgi:hypothetical protein